MSEERDLLAVVRAAAHRQSVARREARERIHRQRQRFIGTRQDSRKELGQRLLAAAGIGQAELDTLSQREEAALRTFLEDEHRALASRPRPTILDQPPRLLRRSPFPDAPQLGYKLIELDTATFIGPVVDQTGSNSRNVVAPDPISPGHNFARAFVEIHSGHQSGFDVGHLNFGLVDFFFAFTADSDIRMNAVSFVDWIGGYTLFAGWYPFDDSRAQATFTVGMDVFVVGPEGGLIGMASAAPDEGFDKNIHVGPFDFTGVYDSFTYNSNSAFIVNGLGVNAGNRVFFRIWAELDVYTKSIAIAQVDLRRH